MDLPTFTMRQLLEAGVHFGHHTRRWNPKMEPYIFGERDKVHIIDLQQTVPMLYQALKFVRDTVAEGGKVLFVGTKRQAQDAVAEAARHCGQYYVNHRWLGGMLTNWQTVSHSIARLKTLDEKLQKEEFEGLTKKERLNLIREQQKLDRALGGIKDMGSPPDVVFVIDTHKEKLAVHEAHCLNIPVIAICDTNADLREIDYPVPGNDDALRAIRLYCDLLSKSVLEGIQAEMAAAGVDVGESDKAPVPALPAETEEVTESSEELASEEQVAEAPAARKVTKAAKAEKAPAKKATKAAKAKKTSAKKATKAAKAKKTSAKKATKAS